MMMTKIVILGGTGYTGRLIARRLLQYSEAGVVIAARNIEKSRAFAAELNQGFAGERAAAVYADAADGRSLTTAFNSCALAVIASPTTTQAATVIDAALEAGVDYLDLQLSSKKLAYLQSRAEEIKSSGRCFITEAGFHPGLPSALVRYAAAELDLLESAITAGYLNMGSDLPWTEAVDELVEGFKDYQAQVYRNGQWTKRGSYDRRRIDFGDDIGVKNCYSMFFEELRQLPEMFPSLKEVGFYISESHWVTDWVVMPVLFVGLKLFPRSVRPLGKLMWWSMGTFHRPPYRVELIVQAQGVKAGRPARLLAGVSHKDGYELTAIPVVATLLQYLDERAARPGLWMMGHFAEPVRLLADMQRMGVRFSSTCASIMQP